MKSRMQTINANYKQGISLTLILVLGLTGCSNLAGKGQVILATDAIQAPTTEQQTLVLAMQAEQGNKLDQAIIYYVKSLAFNPSNSETLYKIGAIQNQLGNTQLAMRAFNQALQADPAHIAALTEVGIFHLQQKNANKAEKLLARALELDQHRLNKPPKGNDYAALDAQSPLQAYNAYGVVNDLRSKHLLARDLFQLALAVTPDDPLILSNLGYSYYLSGNFIVAQDYFNQALALDPSFARAKTNLGLIYIRNGQYHSAVQLLQQVMSKAEAYNDVGYFLMLEGRYKEAQYFLQQAIELSPSYFVKGNANLENVQMYLNQAGSGLANTP